jgi:sugar/nucleoside kinase (ribokinase family)
VARPAKPTAAGTSRLDLLVVGHINLDHFLDVRDLPGKDRTVPIVAQRTELGGTATNIARVAAHFGVAVGLMSRIGDDFPREFDHRLREERIDLDGVEKVDGAHTPACFIVEDGHGGQMTLIDQAAMGDGARRARVLSNVVSRADWVHLGTGDPSYLLRIARMARASGAHLAVDPAQEVHYRWRGEDLRRLCSLAEVLFGNRAEIDRALALMEIRDRRTLLGSVPMVVETLGARGAVAHTRGGTVRVAAGRPRRLRQVTGAGDAFRGGFYAGWFAGQPLDRCLGAGSRAATRWMEGRHAVGVGRPGTL